MLGKAGKVQMLPKALTSGQGGAGDVVCRLLLSGRHFLLVHRLALVLLPQLSRLLADVEAHPGFLPAMPEPSELMQHLQQKGAALTNHPNVSTCIFLDSHIAAMPVEAHALMAPICETNRNLAPAYS